LKVLSHYFREINENKLRHDRQGSSEFLKVYKPNKNQPLNSYPRTRLVTIYRADPLVC